MTVFLDIMVDLETGGTDPLRSPILQLACVPFSLDRSEVGTAFFCQNMGPAWGREWSPATSQWWAKKPKQILASVLSDPQPPESVLKNFASFVRDQCGASSPRFWSRGTTFDWSFVSSYADQFGVALPFKYWDVMDMRTFCRAKVGSHDLRAWEASLPEKNAASHNALSDCIHQIYLVLEAQNAAENRDFGRPAPWQEVRDGSATGAPG